VQLQRPLSQIVHRFCDDATPAHSVMTRSTSTQSCATSLGVVHFEESHFRSSSDTPRARPQAPHVYTGTLLSNANWTSSLSGGIPSGRTESATTLRASTEASPASKISGLCPASTAPLAMKNARPARVGSSEPCVLMISKRTMVTPPFFF